MRGSKRKRQSLLNLNTRMIDQTYPWFSTETRPGIPLNPAHNPLITTFVVCSTFSDYVRFCQACQVSTNNRMMQCLADDDWQVAEKVRGVPLCEVVFLAKDPRITSYYHQAATVEMLRSHNKIRKAYIYWHWSRDQIQPQVAKDGAREW